MDSMKARADAGRSVSERFADWLTSRSGTITFLILNAACFAVWILLNSGYISGLRSFDAIPFSLLNSIVALEGIMLAIVVLISQNRASKIAELREELNLQVNLIAEKEITKVMYLVTILLEKEGVDIASDEELREMLRQIRPDKLEEVLEQQIQGDEPRPDQQTK